ncbi:A disintegrin and metalloproteinase with thrombospondin motifs 18-like [Mya arenaria]|uniref:A disintegrin and metalloproteinase with thrombospondin motifs 18-like n=1 Tax=Mya arenaria TaxID=6604 RepID=UPI0022E7D94E|nr:A disintegrin and metalloproteinase with thrombospondin motifs 18-like [Mya arenaria]
MFSVLACATTGVHVTDILDVHQRMKIFGTNSTHLFPDYSHVKVEELNDENTADLKQFRKRPPNQRVFQMTKNNETFLLYLQQNPEMFTDECIIRELDENNALTVHPCSDFNIDCFYTGNTNDQNDSWVAANVCGGLRGLISYGNTSFVIHPLRNNESSSDVANHIVYRLDQSEKQVCKTDGSPVFTHVVLPRKKRDAPRRFIEAGIIVDPTMYRYHGEKITEYVFTGFNIASRLYADPSIGTDIELVLKELVIFKSNNGFDVDTSANASRTLSSMCQFQSRHQTLQTTDVTIMLTRLDLEHKGVRSTTGVANVGGACSKNEKCGIVRDTGPVFGISLAHVIGHLLGMTHDGNGNNNCTPIHVMSSGRISGDEGFTWSVCSASQLHEALRSLSCLRNNPRSGTLIRYTKLPGVIYTANDQCQLLFDKSAKSIISSRQYPCKHLCCFFNGGGFCASQPVMDGTDCNNTRSWCFRGSCVQMNETFNTAPVHGGWSKWDETFTSCTATCGGGVKFKYRYCYNPVPQYGGRECSGPKFIAKLCNVVPCNYAPEVGDLCQKLNKTFPYSAKGQWHMRQNPFQLMGDDGCKYVCKTNHSDKPNYAVKLPYPNGRICKHLDFNQFSRCIAGVCRSFGCDGVLGSNYSYDSCGVCNGNGKTCRQVIFTVAHKLTSYQNGFQAVTIVPQGSTDVLIEQNNTDVYLGIKVNNITLFDSRNVQKETLIDTHGVRLIYRPYFESIRINGPLLDNFLIVAQARSSANDSNVFSVSVKYHVKDNNVTSRYYWGEFVGQCSRSCGGGLRKHEFMCLDHLLLYIQAEDYLCDLRTKPNEEPTPCNEHACPCRWSTGNWSECSVSCGHGLKTRDINCLQFQDGEHHVVQDVLCASERRPADQMLCDLGLCWKWQIHNESACSKTCSEGFKYRAYICVEAATSVVLPIDTCDEEKKPRYMVNCNHGPCMKSTTCTDDIDHCKYMYGDDICHGRYSIWAEHNCRKSCGVCVQDDDDLCSQYKHYGKWIDLCNERYSTWAARHCRLTCSSCTFEPDHTNCTLYYPDACTDPKYQSWMSKNCGHYCCSNLFN